MATAAPTVPTGPTATKDMWVANLVDPWKEDSSGVPVQEFFESINEAAKMGNLSSKDKVRLARLKLKGTARSFYATQVQLQADDITYEEFCTAFKIDSRTSRLISITIPGCRTLPRRKMRVPKCFWTASENCVNRRFNVVMYK
jgi:hypothetical protein